MQNAAPETVFLKDYKPFDFIIDKVDLTFKLAPNATRVTSKIAFRPNPDTNSRTFKLDGQDLKLIWAKIDGQEVTPNITPEALTVSAPDAPFLWEAEVEIDPAGNTALEGLYMSNGMYCTQCEAEGFRKITYYPDRPDVMAPFTVRIEGDAPVMLSNGNPGNAGAGFAEWHDPWPKPAYLFALVAGDLLAHSDHFTTASGKPVDLNIYVRQGDEDKCAYAMDSLIRSMRWDEKVYGREYDLDVFNIVAVDDFNMGAMENKGLNIFNSKYVLASPETATDTDFENIERIIAHEYFHNWTGNRITCRDWFQLCLKEGLTVFRDQQFSKDERSDAVKRIEDVLTLRARQFREDAGPLAHAVRPESFVEINNFYTATVYEKGAEVIGMLKSLVGDDAYAKALDLYFERHDGEATTIEAWLKVFEDATSRDLSQFKRWYSQAGTPTLRVTDQFDAGTYTLTFEQDTPLTAGQSVKEPQVIPIAVGLLNPNGDEVLPTQILEMTAGQQSFSFEGLASRPVPSILRGFSAPVILQQEMSKETRAFLLQHDTDPFNKWEAGRTLAKDNLLAMITGNEAPDPLFLEALQGVISDNSLDPAFRALVLPLPSEDDLAQTLHTSGHVPDPTRIHDKRTALQKAMATHLEPVLTTLFTEMETPGPYEPSAEAAGKRALRLAALGYLSKLDGGARAKDVFDTANNMTEQLAALGDLVPTQYGADALQAFYDRWSADRLVMDKWFMVQMARSAPNQALGRAKELEQHADFNWKNPNRLRSLLLGMATANPAAFHAEGGGAYQWFADWICKVDSQTPQVAARMTSVFETFNRYDADRRSLMLAALDHIGAKPNLSRDTTEMVERIRSSA